MTGSFQNFRFLILGFVGVFRELLLRQNMNGIEILFGKKRCVGSVFALNFELKVFFLFIDGCELFQGSVFGQVSDSVQKGCTLTGIFKRRPSD